MGRSLGDEVSLFNLAGDNRLKAEVINCGIGATASSVEHRVPHNPAWFVPALIAWGEHDLDSEILRDPLMAEQQRGLGYGGDQMNFDLTDELPR